MDERVYKIALGLLQGIGIVKTKTLAAYAGSAKAVFKSSEKELAVVSGLNLSKIKKFNRKAAVERAKDEIQFMDANGIQLHFYQDVNYPAGLKFCEDAPIVLFSKGNIDFNQQNIAVVGTRKATPYGKSITSRLIKDLTPMRVQIISGLAHGIDKEAHESAIENGLSTIAVLGHGLDLIYPAAHKKLAKKMLKNGGLVTEFLSKTPGEPGNFPQRNRIVAGLSEATVVIESAVTGGSLITANLAFDYNREVFAFPGNIDRNSSQGCNNLIQRNRAHLITCAEDMMEYMGWEMDESSESFQSDLFEALSADEELIVCALKKKNKALHIDELTTETKIVTNELSLHLFNLEMRGAVQSLPGKMYLLT